MEKKTKKNITKQIKNKKPKNSSVKKTKTTMKKKIMKKKTIKKKELKAKKKVIEPKKQKSVTKTTLQNIKVKTEKIDISWLINLFKDHALRKRLVEIGGEETIEVLKGLTKYTSDEDISNNCNIKISDVRAVLNKLHGANIVSYDKTKDERSWFIYHWYIKKNALLELAKEVKQEQKLLENQFNPYEYYFCPNCRAAENIHQDDAAVTDYFCPVCNNHLLPLVEKENFEKNPELYVHNQNMNKNKNQMTGEIDINENEKNKQEIAIEIDLENDSEDNLVDEKENYDNPKDGKDKKPYKKNK
ncbi:MAG: hypothetical protein N3E37_01795 [Candidatus Micrarchaeota archaeon]|nr:hypothetical protein [Candidatus Micrarchaeota archaeon]